jgi:uncharacterized protein
LAKLQMPEQLQDEYGYPAITDETRRKILGANMARVLGVDLDERIRRLSRDR